MRRECHNYLVNVHFSQIQIASFFPRANPILCNTICVTYTSYCFLSAVEVHMIIHMKLRASNFFCSFLLDAGKVRQTHQHTKEESHIRRPKICKMRVLCLFAWFFTITKVNADTHTWRKRLLRKSIEVDETKAENNDEPLSFFGESAPEDRELLSVELAEYMLAAMSMSMPTASPTITSAPTITATPTASPTTSSAPTSTPRADKIFDKCEVTELERSRDILSVLSFVSSPDALITFGTPQFYARAWIDEIDPAIICAEDAARLAQRYRVAVLYYALGGAGWTTSTGWLEGQNECEWFGLSCDGYDGTSDAFFPITEINLNENNVVGELPPEIYGLVEIMNLFMQKNSISGSIPSEIINLSKLAKLDLDTNDLSGSLPSEFYELGQLDTIDLNNNNLNGPLTDAIGNLLQLSILQLENNNFSGPVPATGLLRLEKLCE